VAVSSLDGFRLSESKGLESLAYHGQGKAEEHTYTSPARVTGNQVFYSDENLFSESI